MSRARCSEVTSGRHSRSSRASPTGSVPERQRVVEEVPGHRLVGVTGLEGVGDTQHRVVVAEQVGADAGEDDPTEPLRLGRGGEEHRAGAEAEPDGVDRLVAVGQAVEGEGGEVDRRVGQRRGAVAGQVRGQHRAVGVGEEVEPPGLAPRRGGGGGEAVEQEHGRSGHERRH